MEFSTTPDAASAGRQIEEVLQPTAGGGDGRGAGLRVVEQLIGECCGGRRFDVDRPLREQGLSSLAAARFLVELRRRLGVHMTIEDFLAGASLRDIAARSAAPGDALPEVGRAALSEAAAGIALFPLLQSFLLTSDPCVCDDAVGCHIYREFEVEAVDASAMTAAWERLCALQPMLAARVSDAGRLIPGPAPKLEVIEAVEADALALGELRARWAGRTGRAPDALVKAAFVVGSGRGTLVLSLDALVIDAESLGNLIATLARLLRGEPVAAPGLDYAAAVAQVGTEETEEDRDYWRTRLSVIGAPLFSPPVLGSQENRGVVRERRTLEHWIDPVRWAACESHAAGLGITPTALMLALYCRALMEVAGRRDGAVMVTASRRAGLPNGARDLIGSFTSSMVFPVRFEPGESFASYARRIGDTLWADAAHASVNPAAALRRAGHAAPQDHAAIAFTSLLGIARADAGSSTFHETERRCQTAGMAIDNEMEARDDGLAVRWTVIDAQLPPFAADLAFARLKEMLDVLTGPSMAAPDLNLLQQSYWTQRMASPEENCCAAVFSAELPTIDIDLLTGIWADLHRTLAPLRRFVTSDGGVRELTSEDSNAPLLVLDAGAGLFDDARIALDEALARRRFGFDLGQGSTCCVLRGPDGQASLHIVVDLLLGDGRSLHELAGWIVHRLCADDDLPQPEAAPHAARALAAKDRGYWADKAAALAPARGPGVASPGSGAWRRIESRLAGMRAFQARSRALGTAPEGIMAAAFALAWAEEADRAFTLPLVWWGGTGFGEQSEMSWVVVQPADRPAEPGSGPEALAALHRDLMAASDADRSHGGLAGLPFVARHARASAERGFSLVHTQAALWPDLPPSVAASVRWLTRTPGVDLDAVALTSGDLLIAGCDYRPASFAAGTVERAHARYADLLGMLLDPASGWLETVCAAAPSSVQPTAWTDGPCHSIGTDCFVTRFAHAARSRPNAAALISRAGAMTYAELDRYTNRIGHALRALGVGDGVKVAIAIRRGLDMAAAVIGVLKSGGSYVPIDPAQPTDRAGRMLDIADARLILSDSGTDLAFDPGDRPVIAVDRLPEDAGEMVACVPAIGPDSSAYVIFTSGSTGEPKGVEVAHLAVRNLLDWGRREFDFGPDDIGLCVTPLGFDLSVFDLLGLLSYGAAVYIADEAQQRDPALLLDILGEVPITFWNSAPKMFEHMQAVARAPEDRGAALRLVFLSGDYMSLALPALFRASFPKARLINLGGATEATVWSNSFEVETVDPDWRSIPYGRPISNARYYVLDEALQPCPAGEEGNLYIAGVVLARGYCSRPALTAERFVPDPFHPGSGERMYATGDRAVFRDDGVILFRGRNDGQVKIRGVRIEIGEVEHAMRAHHGVAEAVVLVEADRSGEAKLVAHVEAGADVTPAQLAAFCRTKLPASMCPSRIFVHDRLPINVNGKVDRKRLATAAVAPDAPAPATADRLAEELEQRLAALLGYPVERDADLWQQGVTSFTMVQLGNAMRASTGVALKVEWLLEAPTIVGIADALERHLGGDPAATATGAATPRAEPGAAQLDILDPAATAAFLQQRHNLRRDLSDDGIPFAGEAVPAEWLARRGSARAFGTGRIDARDLRKLLAPLACQPDRGAGVSRFLYPSAGATYPVQIYLEVRSGAVVGLDEGCYWFDPEAARLRRISRSPGCRTTDHFPFNRDAFERCAAALFLVGQPAAIEPLYGEQAQSFMRVEAGYIGQLLMLAQAATGLALRPIGSLREDGIRTALRLDHDQAVLHSFLIGALPTERAATERLPALFGAGAARSAAAIEIRVVGHSLRYPGADSPDALWELLRDRRSAIAPAPRRADGGSGGLGAFLHDVEGFDCSALGIAPGEVAAIDPQARLLMELAFECLERAGHDRDSLEHAGERTGVFVGQMWQDYRLVAATTARAPTAAAAGSELANRISQSFGFSGPSLAVDTACTSSLTALHLACAALRAGECASALVCGVNLLVHPSHLATLEGLGFAAHRPPAGLYDVDAQGWVVGEGGGVILLRRADAFEAHADQVVACVDATHVEHSGARARYGVPSTATIARGLSEVLRKAGLRPDQIACVECAAAGAAMTDQAEWDAIRETFPAGVSIGSLKPNIGHLEAASGLSQLSKVLLEAEHRALLPNRIAAPGPGLAAAAEGAVRIVDRDIPLSGSERHRFLVTAAGSTSGTAQAILSTPPSPAAPVAPMENAPLVLLISAESVPQLRQLVDAYRHALPRFADDDWAAICATTQLARKSFPFRIAVTAETPGEAAHALGGYSDDALAAARAWSGNLDRRSVAGDWRAATTDWLQGQRVAWRQFWAEMPGRRVLPVYPFQRAVRGKAPVDGQGDAGLEGDTSSSADFSAKSAAVRRAFGDATGIDPALLDPQRPLQDYGLTSRIATRMAETLARVCPGAGISPALILEHRDLDALARAIEVRPGGSARPVTPESAAGEPIAVIGYDAILPGCRDHAELWPLLASGADMIALSDRVARPGRTSDPLMVGGFLAAEVVRSFDPLLFGITPKAAARMDPQERLLLQSVWHALEDAARPPLCLREDHAGQVGVYVGCMHNEYPLLGIEASGEQALIDAGGTPAGLANRISYHFDLVGPSLTIDTMCSSSLAALKLAADDLRAGRIEVAIVAAANLSLHANKFVQQRRMGMTSPSARCRSFAADADGFVPGEGVATLILRRAAAAAESGDPIKGLIRGIAIGHGGKANGYTVPNAGAQARVVAAALADGGVSAATISYVETHGTGTVIGDPIEARGLIEALCLDAQAPPLRIGSIKSNLGHLEAAAGLVGIIKLLEQMRHRTLVPSIHAGRLNPDIDWTRLALVRECLPWSPRMDDGRPVWRAGISSFGAGGSNAHAIVEAWPDTPPRPAAAAAIAPQVVALSAASEESLRRYGERLLHWFGEPENAHYDLADICATLQLGREPLPVRWAAVVRDRAEAIAALADFVARGIIGVRGRANAGAGTMPGTADPDALARYWVSGAAIDWHALHPKDWVRAALPRYAFERRECWIDGSAEGVARRGKATEASGPPPADVLALFERVSRPAAQGRPALAPPPVRLETVGGGTFSGSLLGALRSALPGVVIAQVGEGRPGDTLVAISDASPEAWRQPFLEVQARLRQNPTKALHVLHLAPPRRRAAARDLVGGTKLHALLACLAAEHPRLRVTRVEVEEDGMGAAAAAIARCLQWGEADGGAGWAGPCAATWHPLSPAPAPWRPRPDSLYLVTGGTRGIGGRLAEALAGAGARHLALLARAPSEPGNALVGRLRARGISVLEGYMPVEDGDRVADWLQTVGPGAPDIAGVFHLAGIGAQSVGSLATRSAESIAETFRAKVDGLASLAGAVPHASLEFMLLFSSVSAALPKLGVGIGGYAAANRAMTAMGEQLRQQSGLPITSIAWPIWEASTADQAARQLLARHGLPVLPDPLGFDFLWSALATPSSGRLAVASARAIAALGEAKAAGNPTPVPATLATPARAAAPVAPAAGGEARVETADAVRRLVAAETGIPVEDIRDDADFAELGIESIALARLTEAVEELIGEPLNPTVLLDHSTVGKLAGALKLAAPRPQTGAGQSHDATAPEGGERAPAAMAADRKVAVIGMGLRLPGADDFAAFRDLLMEGRCEIGDVPNDRWDVGRLFDPAAGPGKSVSRWGAFLPDLQDFDAGFFGMSDAAARSLDPCIRLALEASQACLRDAGLAADQLAPGTGVFIGARMGDYRLRLRALDAEAPLGVDQNFIAAYLAQRFDIRGPNMVVDAACSSSLVAVHLACQSLVSGESAYAFAGGVDVLLDESVYVQFTRAGALSRTGRCRSFARDADGFVPGEGAVILLLKRLDNALRDGDPIHAVIDGTAVNNDGATMGLTTPNADAHGAVIVDALARAGRRASEIGLVEAHGTGTRIGDPIEFSAFCQAYRTHTDAAGFCALGSVKGNIGHLLSAAGVAGLAKAIVAVETGRIPPSLFCGAPNPRLKLDGSPFYIPQRPMPWREGAERVAAVSAIGLGGTNAHAVLSQSPAHAPLRERKPPDAQRKRRLWIDREGAAPIPSPRTAATIKSLLEIDFLEAGQLPDNLTGVIL